MTTITKGKTQATDKPSPARALLAAAAMIFPLAVCLLGMLANLWWNGRMP